MDTTQKLSMAANLSRWTIGCGAMTENIAGVFDTGVPRFNRDGSFAGYIGSCIDITEPKSRGEGESFGV